MSNSSSKVDSVATIVESFPIPELPKLGDVNQPPTYLTLLAIQAALNSNSSSVDTALGSGRHGHLVLTMQPIAFNLLINPPGAAAIITHNAPVNPGVLAVDANAAAVRVYYENSHHYRLHQSTDRALIKQLIAACPPLYLNKINNKQTGFTNVTCLQMMNHLWTTYWRIKPADLDNNRKTMLTPWSPTEPIEKLFEQINDGADFATAGNSPLLDNELVRIAYNLIYDTGVFELPCREWRAKPTANQTYDHFQEFFQAANNDRIATTSSVGYHSKASANAIIETELSELRADLKKLLAQQKSINNRINSGNNNNSSNNNNNSNNNSNTSPNTNTNNSSSTPTHKGYCHTHGTTHAYKADKVHTSLTCKNPGPNHKNNATENNKLGGSERVWTAATKSNN